MKMGSFEDIVDQAVINSVYWNPEGNELRVSAFSLSDTFPSFPILEPEAPQPRGSRFWLRSLVRFVKIGVRRYRKWWNHGRKGEKENVEKRGMAWDPEGRHFGFRSNGFYRFAAVQFRDPRVRLSDFWDPDDEINTRYPSPSRYTKSLSSSGPSDRFLRALPAPGVLKKKRVNLSAWFL